ncbi:hypothetical protein [Pararhodospirillum oryzae]|uniref:Uncharacterized protein n=1 Tax=Pararhodospirillum oryzae TaxID=478448 RepID=A0A512H3G3_9PROT|nr:hypothetical protein [Pararhodospirillum oryzae]GEO80002.1 hypothetical protein ROR02_01330 [Pararhodospirillum oryzae]
MTVPVPLSRAPARTNTTQTTPAAPAKSPAAVRGKAIKRERTAAKNAMVVTLGLLVYTGTVLAGGRRHSSDLTRKVHLGAGIALMGAAYWHATLYGPNANRSGTARPAREDTP